MKMKTRIKKFKINQKYELFTFSLIKNPEVRPKYPELMEQPFMREYLDRTVDVAGWFREIMSDIW